MQYGALSDTTQIQRIPPWGVQNNVEKMFS